MFRSVQQVAGDSQGAAIQEAGLTALAILQLTFFCILEDALDEYLREENGWMRSALRNPLELAATLVLGAGLTVCAPFAADKPQTFTGKVSDAMCGAHHMMEGNAADCTRACVKKGSKYDLVVGDKVYTLDTQDQATLD